MALFNRVMHSEELNETFVRCKAHNIWQCDICLRADEQRDAVRKALDLLTEMERELSRVDIRPYFDGLREELEQVLEENK